MTVPRVGLRGLLGGLIQDEFGGSTPAYVPTVFWDDEFRELQGVIPLIKVYTTGSPAVPKGLGYTHRKVMNRLTVDIKCKDNARAYNAKEEVIRILGKNSISPFAEYDLIEFDDGLQRTGYTGFYWWLIEVTVWQIRKPIRK